MEQKNLNKLRDDNWFKWSYEMMMLLKSKGLWKNVEYENLLEYTRRYESGSMLMSKEKEIVVNLENKEEKYNPKQEKKSIKWAEDDEKCMALIGLNVSEKFYGLIRACSNAFEAWNKLKKEFDGYNAANLLTIDRVMIIIDRLEEIGCETPQKEICYKILSSLPVSYKIITLSCLMVSPEKVPNKGKREERTKKMLQVWYKGSYSN